MDELKKAWKRNGRGKRINSKREKFRIKHEKEESVEYYNLKNILYKENING